MICLYTFWDISPYVTVVKTLMNIRNYSLRLVFLSALGIWICDVSCSGSRTRSRTGRNELRVQGVLRVELVCDFIHIHGTSVDDRTYSASVTTEGPSGQIVATRTFNLVARPAGAIAAHWYSSGILLLCLLVAVVRVVSLGRSITWKTSANITVAYHLFAFYFAWLVIRRMHTQILPSCDNSFVFLVVKTIDAKYATGGVLLPGTFTLNVSVNSGLNWK